MRLLLLLLLLLMACLVVVAVAVAVVVVVVVAVVKICCCCCRCCWHLLLFLLLLLLACVVGGGCTWSYYFVLGFNVGGKGAGKATCLQPYSAKSNSQKEPATSKITGKPSNPNFFLLSEIADYEKAESEVGGFLDDEINIDFIEMVRRMALKPWGILSSLAFPEGIARTRSERSMKERVLATYIYIQHMYKILFLSLCFLSTSKCLESDLGVCVWGCWIRIMRHNVWVSRIVFDKGEVLGILHGVVSRCKVLRNFQEQVQIWRCSLQQFDIRRLSTSNHFHIFVHTRNNLLAPRSIKQLFSKPNTSKYHTFVTAVRGLKNALMAKIEAQRKTLIDENVGDDDTDESVPMHPRLVWYNTFQLCIFKYIYICYIFLHFTLFTRYHLPIINTCLHGCMPEFLRLYAHKCVCVWVNLSLKEFCN